MQAGEIALRLLVSMLIGAAVGVNRDLHGKPAGLRTLAVVSLGSCALVLGAANLPGAEQSGSVGRALQGIITGIGFIGAGVIMRDNTGGSVHGLTTAAAIFATTAFGALCALGEWVVLTTATALTLLVLMFGGWVERRIEALAKGSKEGHNEEYDRSNRNAAKDDAKS
jgi:putative Mg2+ transporter-C (MgtC) family protein